MISTKLHFDSSVTADQLKSYQEALKLEWKEEKSGYYSLPDTQAELNEKIHGFIQKHEDFENIVVVGIGGSSLGSKAADRLLSHLSHRNSKKLIFLENCDPIEVSTTLKSINVHRSLFLIISKSGGTIETTSIFKLVLSVLGKSELDSSSASRVAFITDEGSPLDKLAQKHKIKAFYIPKSVGGRFSVLSSVGVVPLALAGYNTSALLEGARFVRDDFFSVDSLQISNKAKFYAENQEKRSINTMFAYMSSFDELTKWYVQLWGESLGKLDSKKNRVGLTPIGLIGSVDQHSFLQLIMEGPLDKTVSFIKLASFGTGLRIPEISLEGLEKNDYVNGKRFSQLLSAQADATMQALISAGAPCDEMVIDQLDEWHLGALFMYYMILTSLTGHLMGVNTYDQPGVELGKQILEKSFK